MQSQTTSLAGKLKDKATGEPIPFGNVAIYKKGVLITAVESDIDGNYSFLDIEAGNYDIEASYIGYRNERLKNIVIYAGRHNIIDITIRERGPYEEKVFNSHEGYKEPLIKRDDKKGKVISTNNLPKKVESTPNYDNVSERGISFLNQIL